MGNKYLCIVSFLFLFLLFPFLFYLLLVCLSAKVTKSGMAKIGFMLANCFCSEGQQV